MGALIETWTRVVCRHRYVPGGAVRVRALLADALHRMVTALTATPFDAKLGYRIGFELVTSGVTAPQAFGGTVTLLSQQLIPQLGIGHPEAHTRLAALLGHLVTGFTEASRNVVQAGAEAISRAERASWREEQTLLNRRLQHAALHDRLTGLPNQSQLRTKVAELLDGTGRLGVCLVNLDRFTSVNDSLGRDTGDQLLRAWARRLRLLADRNRFFLAHLGGDEFAVVVEDTTGPDDMVKVVDLVLRTVHEPFGFGGHLLSVTASAGVVERDTGQHPVELLQAAHITLGWAKSSSRGGWTAFDTERHAASLEQHALTAAMPRALHRGEFTLAYQPLIRLADRRLVGVEALARWHSREHGPVSPGRFIPLAEHTGLMGPLGRYLLERACEQAGVWHRRGHPEFVMSVNLSVAQLGIDGLAATVAAILERTGLPACQLQLEVTETALAKGMDGELDALRAIAMQGVRLAIDDFAGYSCLAYLADLPVHVVKLAPGLLVGIGESGVSHSNNVILPALVKLTHDLGLTVIADGVETARQVRILADLNCDLGQGLYLGRPGANRHISRMLSNVGNGGTRLS